MASVQKSGSCLKSVRHDKSIVQSALSHAYGHGKEMEDVTVWQNQISFEHGKSLECSAKHCFINENL